MKKVVIYTSTSCMFCHAAKDFFKENNIVYTEYNISEDKEAKKELIKKGYRSVPIIKVDDTELVGFDKDLISSLLGL
ncbi:glutaredoxin family protein [Clostridium sp.]|uniref:glutaredoxin family protein n=1 Tax=Clostridium sp. TaxID=1506 RepID=UPI001A5FDF1C|nr:glutaredoxin family protein [Clostridium sp.]MBK5241355.1 glutaredoxin family protein [Clostridium sp.]